MRSCQLELVTQSMMPVAPNWSRSAASAGSGFSDVDALGKAARALLTQHGGALLPVDLP
jgi:hypothetical protein